MLGFRAARNSYLEGEGVMGGISSRAEKGAAMPLKPGKSRATISENISEFRAGKTYNRTAKKYGKKKANKQAIAVALSKARASGANIPKRSKTRQGAQSRKPFWA
jgi:Family of unknown function (DUF6496)